MNEAGFPARRRLRVFCPFGDTFRFCFRTAEAILLLG